MLTVGTKIICPNCGIELFEVVKPIHDGGIIKSECFKKINQTATEGVEMKCNSCFTYYFNAKNGTIHTDKGWIS